MIGMSFREARFVAAALLGCAMAALVPIPGASTLHALQTRLASDDRDVERERAKARRDSSRVVRSARGEQARFERIRFRHLPWTWGGSGGQCDEQLGRFCLWHGDGSGPGWRPPEEHTDVRRGRDELIGRLDEAAREVPGDGWIAGQLVRYLLEAERFDEARATAASCQAETWWCAALAGFAAHGAGDFVAAESAYAAALSAMPEKERKEWTDLTPLLGANDAKVYRRTTGEARRALEARAWWLADPLFMIPGNDRLTEHYSRFVWDALQDRARSTEGIPWGSDLRQLLIRYGWPSGWERIRQKPHESGRPHVLTHYASNSRSFLPPLRKLSDLSTIAPEDWRLQVRMSRTEYAPAYAEAFDTLPHQLAAFRRGESSLLVAAFELAHDSIPKDAVVDAALIVPSRDPEHTRIDRRSAIGRRGVFRVTAPAGPAVVSVEALAVRERLAARARYGVRLHGAPAAGLALSDLLLIDSEEMPPRTLEDASRLARPSTTARGGERLGVFWEVYAPDHARAPVVFQLALYRGERGWLRRMVQRVGLGDDGQAVALRWEDRWGEAPVLGRAVNLQLPALAPGRYTLELQVDVAGQAAASVSREIRIIER